MLADHERQADLEAEQARKALCEPEALLERLDKLEAAIEAAHTSAIGMASQQFGVMCDQIGQLEEQLCSLSQEADKQEALLKTAEARIRHLEDQSRRQSPAITARREA